MNVCGLRCGKYVADCTGLSRSVTQMHERNRHKPQWTKSALDDRENSQLNDWSALSISHRDNAMMQPLRADPSFTPCPVVHDDELFPNGIFVFNISRMLEYLENRPTDVELVEMPCAIVIRGSQC